jgi:hypothetical protein
MVHQEDEGDNNRGDLDPDSMIQPQEDWITNAWVGDPEGYLSKKTREYFKQEMRNSGMGRNWMVQQAFNNGVMPEDLSKKEVDFHLKLCSIFHSITRTNQAKLAGLLSDLIPALLERPSMPTIQPVTFLENIMI